MRPLSPQDVTVRNTRTEDIPAIIALTNAVYPDSPPWREAQLTSHLDLFPEGQFVAELLPEQTVIGMAASLIVKWDDYDVSDSWRSFTDAGSFSNHDPVHGRTLYGAEVMVHPDYQGIGVGSMLYAARRDLTIRLGLLRIRAGARLRGYHRYADRMTPAEYIDAVTAGDIADRTLSFQLARGFRVIGVVHDYLHADPDSLGHAALIEWVNPDA